MLVAINKIIGEAFSELNVLMPGASIPDGPGQLALSKLQQILDNWNAERDKVWAEVFLSGTLTPSLSPHTIGPTGTFAQAIRPVSIEGCSLNLNNTTPNVYVPIDLIDSQIYEALSVPGISTSIPTAVYYETDWPNGKLFFYPIPNTAYGVRFRLRTLLTADVALTDNLDMPPGYQEAITLTLAEALATPSGRAVPLQTARAAARARARIGTNNIVIPLLDLRDGQQRRQEYSNFNYHSRSFTS